MYIITAEKWYMEEIDPCTDKWITVELNNHYEVFKTIEEAKEFMNTMYGNAIGVSVWKSEILGYMSDINIKIFDKD